MKNILMSIIFLMLSCFSLTLWAAKGEVIVKSGDWASERLKPRSGKCTGEYGLKFSVQKTGKITVLRFYQAKGESGPHQLRLWDNAGKLLLTVDAPAAKGAGWVKVSLPKPFEVYPGDVLTVSYTCKTHLAAVIDFFIKPIVRGGITGIAGVYRKDYLGEKVPNKIYRHYNYFVDVVYEQSKK